MSNAIVSNVYRYVIDDVINQVRGEFEDMGIDDAVLQELQRSWETKVARSRVANFGFSGGEGYYEEEGEQQSTVNNDNDKSTTADTYSDAYSSQSSVHAAAANLASIANSGVRNMVRPETTNRPLPSTLPHPSIHPPSSYSLPPTHLPPVNGPYPPMNLQRPPPNLQQPSLPDLHLPGSRHNIPQNDGVRDDMTQSDIDTHLHERIMQAHEDLPQLSFSATSVSGDPLALENLPDHVQLLIKDARERARTKSRMAQLDGEDDNDDINSDLDDSDDDDDDGEGAEEVEHIILCLYDKVTRTKNKWKCVLRDGIMLVNGRDYLFHRANGDFEW